jgi:hypothetical protein
MARHTSLAEHYRAHRAEMELALATGCTPIEARRELRRREKERRARCGRHAADSAPATETTDKASTGERFGDWDARWMMRD